MYYGIFPNPYVAHPAAYPSRSLAPYHTYHDVRNENEIPNNNLQDNKGHTHAHYGATTCDDGHTHLHPGVTGIPIHTPEGHIHKIFGNTTFDDDHIHYYEAYTSPPIQLPNGYHTHYAEIKTTESDGHVHIIRGFTAPSKD